MTDLAIDNIYNVPTWDGFLTTVSAIVTYHWSYVMVYVAGTMKIIGEAINS